jgi:hypothetical protein
MRREESTREGTEDAEEVTGEKRVGEKWVGERGA